MPSARELRDASASELRAAIVNGFPVDPKQLEGFAYRGTNLLHPRFARAFSWVTFQKTFWRDPASGRLFGWNVRLEQDGIDAPSRPKLKHGAPRSEWFYEVIAPDGVVMPRGFDRGLVIDYARGAKPNGPFMRLAKDPLVSLSADSCDELLGVTYLTVGGVAIETPTYFTLVRDAPLPPGGHP